MRLLQQGIFSYSVKNIFRRQPFFSFKRNIFVEHFFEKNHLFLFEIKKNFLMLFFGSDSRKSVKIIERSSYSPHLDAICKASYNKSLLILYFLICLIFISSSANAQQNDEVDREDEIDEIFNLAMSFFNKNEIGNAKLEFSRLTNRDYLGYFLQSKKTHILLAYFYSSFIDYYTDNHSSCHETILNLLRYKYIIGFKLDEGEFDNYFRKIENKKLKHVKSTEAFFLNRLMFFVFLENYENARKEFNELTKMVENKERDSKKIVDTLNEIRLIIQYYDPSNECLKDIIDGLSKPPYAFENQTRQGAGAIVTFDKQQFDKKELLKSIDEDYPEDNVNTLLDRIRSSEEKKRMDIREYVSIERKDGGLEVKNPLFLSIEKGQKKVARHIFDYYYEDEEILKNFDFLLKEVNSACELAKIEIYKDKLLYDSGEEHEKDRETLVRCGSKMNKFSSKLILDDVGTHIDPENVTRLNAHLGSDEKTIKTRRQPLQEGDVGEVREIELGYTDESKFLGLYIRVLVHIIQFIHNDSIEGPVGVDMKKNELINLMKSEMLIAIATINRHDVNKKINFEGLKKTVIKKEEDEFVSMHAGNILRNIRGSDEYCLVSGYDGHTLYVNFSKASDLPSDYADYHDQPRKQEEDGVVYVRVDNFGNFYHKHPGAFDINQSERQFIYIYPCLVKTMQSFGDFQDVGYIEEIIKTRFLKLSEGKFERAVYPDECLNSDFFRDKTAVNYISLPTQINDICVSYNYFSGVRQRFRKRTWPQRYHKTKTVNLKNGDNPVLNDQIGIFYSENKYKYKFKSFSRNKTTIVGEFDDQTSREIALLVRTKDEEKLKKIVIEKTKYYEHAPEELYGWLVDNIRVILTIYQDDDYHDHIGKASLQEREEDVSAPSFGSSRF